MPSIGGGLGIAAESFFGGSIAMRTRRDATFCLFVNLVWIGG
jgi:hypothetical protein